MSATGILRRESPRGSTRDPARLRLRRSQDEHGTGEKFEFCTTVPTCVLDLLSLQPLLGGSSISFESSIKSDVLCFALTCSLSYVVVNTTRIQWDFPALPQLLK